MRFPVTQRRTVTQPYVLGSKVRILSNANYKKYYEWHKGYDSTIYMLTAGGDRSEYLVLAKYTLAGRNAGLNETASVSWAVVDSVQPINHTQGLRVWGIFPYTMPRTIATKPTITYSSTNGNNFYNFYTEIHSIWRKDFFRVKKNGDIIMWRNFDRHGWYDGLNYD
ncbi:MAG: hypothetical protein ACK5NK_07610 [Niabella sp.]